MATDVMITGSGIPLPSPGRAGAGALVRHDGTMIQVDAGPATTFRLTEAAVDITELAGIVITHHHSDHLMGIPDLVLTRWIRHGARPCPALPIHCPAGHAVDYVESLFHNLQPDIEARIGLAGFPDRPDPAVHPFEPQQTKVATFGAVLVESVLVEHGGVRPAVAYRFTTPDGVVVISGDTRACDAVERLATGADILVHEVLCSAKLLELGLPAQRVERLAQLHAEAPTLGALAARAGVRATGAHAPHAGPRGTRRHRSARRRRPLRRLHGQRRRRLGSPHRHDLTTPGTTSPVITARRDQLGRGHDGAPGYIPGGNQGRRAMGCIVSRWKSFTSAASSTISAMRQPLPVRRIPQSYCPHR